MPANTLVAIGTLAEPTCVQVDAIRRTKPVNCIAIANQFRPNQAPPLPDCPGEALAAAGDGAIGEQRAILRTHGYENVGGIEVEGFTEHHSSLGPWIGVLNAVDADDIRAITRYCAINIMTRVHQIPDIDSLSPSPHKYPRKSSRCRPNRRRPHLRSKGSPLPRPGSSMGRQRGCVRRGVYRGEFAPSPFAFVAEISYNNKRLCHWSNLCPGSSTEGLKRS